VEFPIFDDGQVIKQGTGEILAYLLSGASWKPA
jgi:pyruvate formate lyase activating enzyme